MPTHLTSKRNLPPPIAELQTILENVVGRKNKILKPVHPGKVFLEEFLMPINLSQYRLARYFDMPPEFWLGLQMDYDLDVTENESADLIKRELQVYAAP